MKICHIISAFYRYDARIFWKQCRALVEAGYEVVLITNDELDSEINEGIQIIPSGFRNSSRLKRILFSRRISLEKAIEVDADLYQIHDPEFIPLGLSLKKRGKPVIYDSHEDFPGQILEKDWIPSGLRKALSKAVEFYFNKNLKKFDAVLTVTPHIAAKLRRSCDKVFIITNYPVLENNYIAFTEEEYVNRGNFLCYSGTVYRSSLQENVLKAIKNLTYVDYLIVGVIDENYKAELLKLGINNAQFMDFVPRLKLNDIYTKASAGIAIFDYSPNLGYTLGSLGVNKIYEYMYFGLPIICTDFTLWKEMIEKYNCGMCVNPLNVAEIQDAIIYLAKNKKEAYKMGQNGRNAVLQEYNWSSQQKIYIDIVKTILN